MNEAIQGPDAVVRLRIQGPPTPSHFTHVASTIRAVDGVQAVYADHRAGIAWALLHTSATSSHAICQRLKAVSIAATASTFRPAAFVEDHQAFGAFVGQQSRSIIYVLAWSAGVVALDLIATISGWLGETAGHSLRIAAMALLVGLAMYRPCRAIIADSCDAIRYRVCTWALPITMCMGTALAAGVLAWANNKPQSLWFTASTAIMAGAVLARWLEDRAYVRSWSALVDLAGRLPTEATRIAGPKAQRIGLHEIKPLDMLTVSAGSNVPVDGTVVDGEAFVDNGPTSWTPGPHRVGRNDAVEAGASVTEGNLTIQAASAVDESRLPVVLSMAEYACAERAGGSPPRHHAIATWCGIAVGVGCITFVGSWMLAGASVFVACARAVAAVLVCSGCAAAADMSSGTGAAIASALRGGCLFTSRSAFRLAASIHVIMLDKSGTLTTGKPSVVTVFDEPVDNATLNAKEIIQLAASAEQGITHPFAQAIVAKAREWNLELESPTEQAPIPGSGIVATIAGRTIRVGNPQAFRRLGISLAPAWHRLHDLVADGQSVVAVAVDNACAGLIGLSDPTRGDAPAAVDALNQLGVATVMVTGDVARTAAEKAASMGLCSVCAELTSAAKAEEIIRLQRTGRRVAFMGDIATEQDAIRQADVGIAWMPRLLPSDTHADACVLQNNLMCVPAMVQAAQRTAAATRGNRLVVWLCGVVALPAAILGWLHPAAAAVATTCLVALATHPSRRDNGAG